MDDFLATFLGADINLAVEDEPEVTRVTMVDRIAMCGKKWGGYFRPQDGKWSAVPFKCNQWRECPTCLADRATIERSKIEVAAQQAELRYIELPATEMDTLCYELGKKNFRRYPGETVDQAFFITDNTIGQAVTADFLAELDWKTVVYTPKGRKLSGSLGFIVPGSSSALPTIKIECVMSDAEPKLRQAAVQWAIDETPELRPTTVDEVQAAIERRTYEYKKYLWSNGATIWPAQTITVAVHLDQLDWSPGGYWANHLLTGPD